MRTAAAAAEAPSVPITRPSCRRASEPVGRHMGSGGGGGGGRSTSRRASDPSAPQDAMLALLALSSVRCGAVRSSRSTPSECSGSIVDHWRSHLPGLAAAMLCHEAHSWQRPAPSSRALFLAT